MMGKIINMLSKKLKLIGFVFVVVFLIIVFVYFGAGITAFPPDNTLIFIDVGEKTYFAPPLLLEDERNFLVVTALALARKQSMKPATEDIVDLVKALPDDKVIFVDMKKSIFFLVPQDGYTNLYPDTLGKANGRGFSPDSKHRDWGGFVDDYGFIDKILSLIGKRKGRWTDDGDWRW